MYRLDDTPVLLATLPINRLTIQSNIYYRPTMTDVLCVVTPPDPLSSYIIYRQ